MPAVLLDNPLQAGLRCHQQGRLGEAERAYRAVLAEQPEHPVALHLLGVIAGQVGRPDEAVSLIRRAIAGAPGEATFHSNLGMFLTTLGKYDEAAAACRESIRLNAGQPDAWNNLANALLQKRQWREARAACEEALRLNAGLAEARFNLAYVLWQLGDFPAAAEAYRVALVQRPAFAEGHNLLGMVLHLQGQVEEAIGAYREALRQKPQFAEAAMNLGCALKDVGEIEEAVRAAQAAVAMDPRHVEAHSNLIYTMIFHPGYDEAAIQRELARWNERHAAPLRASHYMHLNDRTPGRRLRVGYVSPDFRDHVIGRNLLPLFAHHDRAGHEIFCYADVPHPDAVTEEFRRHCDCWRPICGFSDAAVADLIRGDRIDILVDLTLHMRHQRLQVFARKPAPVQVTFAGYPGSTGLEAIDYRLSDPHLDPPAAAGGPDPAMGRYVERTIRLPHSFWCYDALGEAPEVNALPAGSGGGITFGCLNNFCKVNGEVLRVWAKVLKAVPGSRLMLLAPEGAHRQRTANFLLAEGVERERVAFVEPAKRMEYLRYYHQIDISLDTFPYNGHTTGLDSLFMGVPTVTLVGDTVVGRAGLSQLTNLGLPELIARSADAYVRIATDLAGDRTRLAHLRGTLRRRMEDSPLMNALPFARGIEGAYREMWGAYCFSRLRA